MTIRQALARKGYSDDMIDNIIGEARNSSNPEYILSYWGINGEKYANQLKSES